ncbi:ATP-binding protein [Planctomycetota bacterium]
MLLTGAPGVGKTMLVQRMPMLTIPFHWGRLYLM